MTTFHSFIDLYQEKITPEVSREMIDPLDIDYQETPDEEAPAFSVNDTIIWWNNIDWKLQRERARAGVNNCGLVLAVIGTKLNDLGTYLAQV